MTKKHYEAIAKILNRARDEEKRGYKTDTESIAVDLANYFNKDNKNFIFVKFMQSCGYTDYNPF